MLNALTIHVEDYFHVTAFEWHVKREDWGGYPLRVFDNTLRILDMLDEFSVFFNCERSFGSFYGE